MLAADTTGAVVSMDGRNIQRDGFLLEWDIDQSRRFAPGLDIRWDAMNTPEGFAGYVQYPYSADKCGTRTFFFEREEADTILVMELQTPGPEGKAYNVHLDTERQDSLIAAEWLIPWTELKPDSGGNYRIRLSVQDSCDQQAPTLVISGKTNLLKKDAPETISSPRLIFQGVIIAILLIAYILVRAQAKKLKKKEK